MLTHLLIMPVYLVGIYLTTVMALTSISVILTVFVLNLHYRGPDNTPVPSWLRTLFLRRKKLTRGLCFKPNSPYINEYLSDGQSHYVKNVSLKMTIENLAQELKEELDQGVTGSATTAGDAIQPENRYHDDVESINGSVNRRRSASRKNSVKTQHEILAALRKIVERYEADDKQESVMYEWRQVAVQVDCILFWIFLVGTLTSTVVLLIVAPIVRWF